MVNGRFKYYHAVFLLPNIAYAMPLRMRASIAGMTAKISGTYSGLSNPPPLISTGMTILRKTSTAAAISGAKSKRPRPALIAVATTAAAMGMTAAYYVKTNDGGLSTGTASHR